MSDVRPEGVTVAQGTHDPADTRTHIERINPEILAPAPPLPPPVAHPARAKTASPVAHPAHKS